MGKEYDGLDRRCAGLPLHRASIGARIWSRGNDKAVLAKRSAPYSDPRLELEYLPAQNKDRT